MNNFFTKRVATTAVASVKRAKIEEVVAIENKENGASELFKELATTLQKIEATTKRLEIQDLYTDHIYKLFKSCPGDILGTIYLSSGRVAPDYMGVELGIGDGLLTKAIGQSFGKSVASIKKEMETEGDLATVAEISRQNQKTMFAPKPLTIQKLYTSLKEIAQLDGKQSQQRKVDKICGLLSAGDPIETRYIIRILSGKMRIGLSEQTLLVGISRASAKFFNYKDLKEAEAILKSVFCELPSFDAIVPILIDSGIENLSESCKLLPGVPVKPMLAHPSKSIDEVLKRFSNKTFTCEYKYDGERAQLHKTETSQYVYSRNSENLSGKYPEILELITTISTCKSFILDCEAVAYDPVKKTILPFQELQKRKRKNVTVSNISVPVIIYPFDLLYLNGESLLKKTYEERRALMLENFKEIPLQFEFASYKNCDDTDEIMEYLQESIEAKCEGLMLKTLVGSESSYEPSKRSLNWFKLKKDYLTSTGGDTLDLVVIGAWYGKGKRTGGFGAYLLATWDSDKEEYQSVCKLGTGLKDDVLERFTKELTPLIISKPNYYNSEGKPDVWFEATKVWEIQAADFTLSPLHTAAAGYVDDKGISLRFPRFIQERLDKKTEDCTSPEQLADMYKSQAVMQDE